LLGCGIGAVVIRSRVVIVVVLIWFLWCWVLFGAGDSQNNQGGRDD
jgi:hypothetical protein